jgi:hypothetical protein
MQTVAPDSLLDEENFLADLVTLEEAMTAKPRTRESLQDLSTPIRTAALGKFVDPVVATAGEGEGRSAQIGQAAAAMIFVLMMVVGAAAATAVFHERVGLILASLRIR